MGISKSKDAPIVLVAGIPASGKSTYGLWLDKHKGFLHLDVEQGVLERYGLQSSWDELFSTRSAAPFLTAVRKFEKPVVINWGFPPSCLNVEKALKVVNVSVWWFDGDRAAARKAFIQRGTVPLGCFERQMNSIDEAWPQISRLFDSQIIRTIRIGPRGPRFLAPAKIFTRMFAKDQE